MYDSHMHTTYSFDGNATILQMVEAAANMGLKEITITDHIDFDDPYIPEGMPNAPDLDVYFAEIAAAKQQYEGKILVHAGLEIGVFDEVLERTHQYVEGYAMDFVLGSMHTAKPDMHDPAFWQEHTRQSGFGVYLQNVLDNFRVYTDYDCISHLTYFSRYAPFTGTEREILATDAPQLLQELFAYLIANGKGIEVNTSTIKRHGFAMPDISIVKLYRQMGGEIITIGSDAHRPDNIAANFTAGLQMLQAAGFDYVCTFVERSPVFHRL
ncbi:histidinol-phosphatase HisJ family protein [Eubacteriales bacterium OttesenSCG-928-N14]|nr:histidinol-phosphatase HisJ family protein [Eubacteriales bacterium OttesenSCG-928-N14]